MIGRRQPAARPRTARSRLTASALGLLAASLLLVLPTAAGAQSHDMREGVMWTEHYSQPRHAAQAAAQGTEVVRLPIRWNQVSPRPPGTGGPLYDWSRYDALIEDLARNRIDIVLNLTGTTPWAAETGRGGIALTRRPPVRSAHADWLRFVEATVRRYGPGGTFWWEHAIRGDPLPHHTVRQYEIWNEPNLNPNWRNGRTAPQDYGRFMVDTARAVNSVSPGARILGVSLCYCGVSPVGFLQKVLSVPGARQVMDELAYHVYRPGWKSQLIAAQALRAGLAKAGARRKPLHLTEFGWGTCAGLYRKRVCVTPRHQAQLLDTTFRELERHSGRLNLAAAHWFMHEDLCARTDPRCRHTFFGHFGLSYKGGERKPAWEAYRRRAAE